MSDWDRVVEIMRGYGECVTNCRKCLKGVADAIIAEGFGDVAARDKQISERDDIIGGMMDDQLQGARDLLAKDKKIERLRKHIAELERGIKDVISSKDIPQEYAKLINKHFWELTAEADRGR